MIFIIRRSRWILGDLEDEEADVEEATKRKGKRPLGKGAVTRSILVGILIHNKKILLTPR